LTWAWDAHTLESTHVDTAGGQEPFDLAKRSLTFEEEGGTGDGARMSTSSFSTSRIDRLSSMSAGSGRVCAAGEDAVDRGGTVPPMPGALSSRWQCLVYVLREAQAVLK
jgi:hypothetical protein